MENPTSNAGDNGEIVNRNPNGRTNIILNHDFSEGLHLWDLNSRDCDGYVISTKSADSHAVVTDRKECWHGLEQDITSRVSLCSTYSVSARVSVSGSLQGSANIIATLKLEYQGSGSKFVFIGRTSVSKEKWKILEGTFSLFSMPDQVRFYLEGPSPGVDLLIQSVVITCSSSNEYEIVNRNTKFSNRSFNIILNHDFSEGLHSWHPNSCDCDCYAVSTKSADSYAVVTDRKEFWHGLEQDITSRVSLCSTYSVSACVRLSGPLQESANVIATLKLEYQGSGTRFVFIGRTSVTKEEWKILEGTFSLLSMPDRVLFYLEGPSPGVDLHIQSVVIKCSSSNEYEIVSHGCLTAGEENIILNSQFEDGLNNWSGRGCKIVLNDLTGEAERKIVPLSGNFFASATERKQSWNGIQQEITGRVRRKLAYDVTAVVRLSGNNVTSTHDVRLTLWVQTPDLCEQYIGVANAQATDSDWVQLKGNFLLNGSPSRVIIYIEGPPSGTDILVNSFIVKQSEENPPSPPPVKEALIPRSMAASTSHVRWALAFKQPKAVELAIPYNL